jgi:ribonucleotide monophosphatase NagD (HAD superfamily)
MAQGLLIDMDGVIYAGDVMIPGADSFIANLLKKDIPFIFMTNNSQRIVLSEKHVYTSAMTTDIQGGAGRLQDQTGVERCVPAGRFEQVRL